MDEILEDDFRYKLFIYKVLMLSENYLEETILANTLELSSFKTRKYLFELIEDVQFMGIDSFIVVKDNKIIEFKNLTQKDYNNIRRYYFEHSLQCNFLVQVAICENYLVPEYAEMCFLSKGSAYSIVKKINDFLVNWNIKLKKSRFIGNELDIRLFCFQLLFYYYGTHIPRSLLKNANRIETLLSDLQLIFSKSFTANQFAQLKMILCVQYTRINNKNFAEESILVSDISLIESNLSKWFNKNDLFLDKFQVTRESEFIMLFLVLNQYIENEGYISIEETKGFKLLLHHLNLKKLDYIPDDFIKLAKLLFFKWEYTKFSFSAFVADDQYVFFKESFPKTHELVHNIVSSIKKNDSSKWNIIKKTHLYYDLMFAFLKFKDMRRLEKFIYVNVDFSGGDIYNQFIKTNIDAFNYLNIILDEKLMSHTDIYISDIYNHKVLCKQVIWKKPPLEYDWKLFAEMVIKLKGES